MNDCNTHETAIDVATLGPLTAMADLYLESQITDGEINISYMLGEACNTYEDCKK